MGDDAKVDVNVGIKEEVQKGQVKLDALTQDYKKIESQIFELTKYKDNIIKQIFEQQGVVKGQTELLKMLEKKVAEVPD